MFVCMIVSMFGAIRVFTDMALDQKSKYDLVRVDNRNRCFLLFVIFNINIYFGHKKAFQQLLLKNHYKREV